MDSSMIQTLLNGRASVRQFKSEKVDIELVRNLLRCAGRASTTGNMQLYSAVITTSESDKERLAPAHFCQRAFMSAPMSITFCADFHRFERWCEVNGAVPGYGNELSFLTAVVDATIVAQTFCTLAEAEGLGICYLGTAMYNPALISEVLGLPEKVVSVVTVVLGWPDEKPELSDRLSDEAWVFEGKYNDFNDDDIHRLYDYKDEIEANKGFVAENGKQRLAEVFTDVRYTKKTNEAVSETLINFLREKGFLFVAK